ncbi:DUF3617 domain-containing protein [Henriciella litoralis]|uniref:DUF3617 domain-containing protein n=1 Tax=Henriciella litoralis TaxID=568102 RepID=UPI00146A437C|nr:DUF3617 family protein [Henriciella litoralis]
MRIKTLTACAMFAMLPISASADTNVRPGLWSYQASFALGPIPMQDVGSQCIDPVMAGSSYDALLNDINANCEVTSSSYQTDGYHFKMRCAGGPDGELSGRLTVNGDQAQLNATGWTGTTEENVPVILSASASRVATTCQ